jgi:hypothetical protein
MAVETRDLIARITEEVLKRISLPEEKVCGTLAIFPGYVFDPEAITEYLKKNHENITCVLLDDAQFESGKRIDSQQAKDSLAGRLKEYEKIVIVTPPLWLMSATVRGDDSIYTAMLVMRPLLWGRDVTMLLDFEAPKNRRSPAFLKLAEDISALEEMGINIEILRQKCTTGNEPKELVTEQDVKEACKSEDGLIRIKPGAIVTQLAQDTAKELGVNIEVAGGSICRSQG